MATQWTVTFDASELDDKGRALLEGYLFEEVQRSDRTDVDMSEEQFFGFLDELQANGRQLSVDGSSSWAKAV